MKAEIVEIGNEDMTGWVFDCKGQVPGFSIDTNGDLLRGGYSEAELIAITRAAEVIVIH